MFNVHNCDEDRKEHVFHLILSTSSSSLDQAILIIDVDLIAWLISLTLKRLGHFFFKCNFIS